MMADKAMSLTREEQFIVDMTSCLDDTINGHIGLLRRVAERMDESIMDEVHGSLQALLLGEIEDLQKKRLRGIEKIQVFAGGKESWQAIHAKWWTVIANKELS